MYEMEGATKFNKFNYIRDLFEQNTISHNVNNVMSCEQCQHVHSVVINLQIVKENNEIEHNLANQGPNLTNWVKTRIKIVFKPINYAIIIIIIINL